MSDHRLAVTLTFALATPLATLLLNPSVTHAANLVTNPGFGANLSGWTVPSAPGVTVEWSPVDQLDEVSSGSLHLGNLSAYQGVSAFSNCFPTTPGTDLVFGAAFFAPDTQYDGNGHVSISWFPGPGCTGGSIGSYTPQFRHYFYRHSTWGPAQGTATVPEGAQSAQLRVAVTPFTTPLPGVFVDNVFVYESATCATTPNTICLGKAGRFRVSAEWRTPDGTKGWARTEYLSHDAGHLWFFKPGNVEGLLKVHDACAFNDRYWVFAAGLTNVEVKLHVFDTWTDTSWSHVNPLGTAFEPVQDTAAFATCFDG